jgi:hypothetical protein
MRDTLLNVELNRFAESLRQIDIRGGLINFAAMEMTIAFYSEPTLGQLFSVQKSVAEVTKM